ncbi:MAG TPA: HD domain-containing protein [Gemmatimonadales bacterium]|nr:HD domain-containing protein [Gemmatimonadales bacterium]
MVDLPSWACVSEARRAHIWRVAQLMDAWATAMNVSDTERARWWRAAMLHDAMRDAPAATLGELAPEWAQIPKLQHGPAAATLAERHGERDRGVLDAVRYHSTGYADWDAVGRLLYLADYLEPGRQFRQAERRAMADRVPREPERVLLEVARERLRWAVDAGRPLLSETVRFWNALVSAQP